MDGDLKQVVQQPNIAPIKGSTAIKIGKLQLLTIRTIPRSFDSVEAM